MINSGVFVLLFILLATGMLLYPRNDKKENIVVAIPVILLMALCLQAAWAFGLYELAVEVDLLSSMAGLVVGDIVIWLGIVRKKQIQHWTYEWIDIVCLLFPVLLVVIEAVHMFSDTLRLSYINDDAQAFFSMAMQIVRGKKLGTYNNAYLNAYVNAILIEIAEPWIRVVDYVKVFIVGDILMHLLEIGIFYSVLSKTSRTKEMRYVYPIICIFYFLGYPTFSFMSGNFVYWSTGGVLFLYLIYALIGLQHNWKERSVYYLMLVLGVWGSIACNRLYAVINTIVVLGVVCCIIIEKKEMLIKRNQKMIFGGSIMSIGIIFALFHEQVWNLLLRICASLQADGFGYTSLYKEYILFIPVIICMIVYGYRKKISCYVVTITGLLIVAITVGMLWLCLQAQISVYYYYKIYYCLWIVMWLMAAVVLDVMIQEKRGIYAGIYMIFLICLAVNQLGEKSETDDNNFFRLYHDNLKGFQRNYAGQEMLQQGRYTPSELLDDYQYLIDYYGSDQVCFVSDYGNYMQGRWFAAIVGTEEFYFLDNFPEVVNSYLAGNTLYPYIVMGKQSGIYGESCELLNDKNIEYEDNLIVVVKTNCQ